MPQPQKISEEEVIRDPVHEVQIEEDEEQDQPSISPLNSEFLSAVRGGDLLEVVRLLDAKAYVNVDDGPSQKWTALHFAALKSNLEMAQLLCNARADVNALDADQEAPISKVNTYEKDPEGKLKLYLIEQKATFSPDEANILLINAADDNSLPLVEYLLEKKADPCSKKALHVDKQTALHKAVLCGSVGVVQKLMAIEGIETESTDSKNQTPLQLAESAYKKAVAEQNNERAVRFKTIKELLTKGKRLTFLPGVGSAPGVSLSPTGTLASSSSSTARSELSGYPRFAFSAESPSSKPATDNSDLGADLLEQKRKRKSVDVPDGPEPGKEPRVGEPEASESSSLDNSYTEEYDSMLGYRSDA